jgi:hypothetical protein
MALPVIHLDRAQQAAFTGWAGEVSIYADLPVATAVAGEFWMVLNPTGSRFLLNYKASGLYLSEAGVWRKINDAQILLNDNQFSVYNAVDNTKQIAFDASVIATATKRTATWPDKDGTVAMLSDITGGGVFTPTINSTNMVEVSQESDFGVAVGSVITLTTNTTYFIRGNINCTNRLLIDAEGIAIVGWDRDKDGLTYTSSGGDFITVDDVNCEIANIKLSSTNSTGGEVVLRASNFNYGTYNDGRNKVLTMINCQFRNCFDVWHIEGFDLVDIQNTLVWYIQSSVMGCHFKNVSKLQLSSCEYVRWFDETSLPTPLPADYATTPMIELLANGLGNGFGAVNINGCIFHPQQTQDGINISTTSTTGFGTIAASTFVNQGLTTGNVFAPISSGLPDYSQTATYNYDVFSNQGILNSSSGCVMTLQGNNNDTNLTANVPAKVETDGLALSQASVRFTVATNGRCTYNASKQIYVSLHATLGYDRQGGGTDDYVFSWYKNGAELTGSETQIAVADNHGASGTISMVYGVLMNQNDYIEIWVENADSNDDMIVRDWQVVIRE